MIKARWAAWASRAGLGVGLLAVAIGVLGRFGDVFALLDVVNHFAPIWLTVGAIAAGLATWGLWPDRRRRHLAPCTLLLIGVLAVQVLGPDHIKTLAPQKRGSGERIRIVQFNLWKQNRAPAVAARWILAQDPDVIVLEEAAASSAEVREQLRAHYPYMIDCFGRDGRCSTIILSARPPLAGAGLAHGDPENQGALSAAWGVFDLAGAPVTIVGAHYVRPPPFGDQTKGQAQLIGFVQSHPREHMVLAGDFNATPWSFALRRQDKLLGLRRVTRALATWPNLANGDRSGRRGLFSPPPVLPIDHVYLGPDLHLVSVRRGPALGSDHYPVVVDFQLAAP